MKSILRTIILSLVLVTGCCSAPMAYAEEEAPALPESSAEISLSVRPSNQEIELDPGKSAEGLVTVYNFSDTPVDIEVSISPYQAVDNGDHLDFSTESSYTQLSKWIKLREEQFHIEPDHNASVYFDIDVPAGVAGGGQYAAVIIRSKDASGNNANVSVTPQIAALLYGHVSGPEARKEGKLASYKFPRLMVNGLRIASTFENTGNIDYRVTETLSIRDFFTNREALTPSSSSAEGYALGTSVVTILPGTRRNVEMVWHGAPELGFFRVTHTINFLDEEHTTTKVVLICPLWLVIIAVMAIAALILWIASSIIRRRREAPQVLKVNQD